ncbi:hypothetical protein [Streptomyces sp. NPDC029554]|uniref:hypothetical protein n=1 Tax=Streptomyces sp. NPDC029554 TaxID=3155126 RepID=UPI0033DB872C
MSDTRPGADELRMRAILKTRGVGPDAPPAIPPMPRQRPRDWFDDLAEYNAPTPAAPAPPRRVTKADPEPEPQQQREPRDWTWLTAWLRPWQTLTAGAVAVLPAFNGWSLATGWANALHDMRIDHLAGAYTTAGVALVATFSLDLRRGRFVTRVALVTAAIGATGALDWFDPITLVTGVTR